MKNLQVTLPKMPGKWPHTQLLITVYLLSMAISVNAQTHSSFITIEGEVLKPLKLTITELARFPQSGVSTKDKQGNAHVYKGVLLSAVLDSAGVTLGKELRGENLTKYVLIKAVDGYEVVYALPEIDPEFTSNTVLLATQVDGKPLPKGEGPFRIINPADKTPARWIREISTIQIRLSK